MQIFHNYRLLHTIPELDRELPKTTRYIRGCLLPLKCTVISPAEGAVCAFFDFGRSRALAFRAEMDALPVTEQTQLPWRSRHPGRMHACGHDGHIAILLELARRLHKMQTCAHNVLLIFQPGEETCGGAKELCDCGVLEQYAVEYIFALHIWPGLEEGQLFSCPGPLMCRSAQVQACFTGSSAHIARREQGVDALKACVELYQQAEQVVSEEPFLLHFGQLEGGTAGNVVCDRAVLNGSLRCFSTATQLLIQQQLQTQCEQIREKTGCQCRLSFTQGYPAVENPLLLYLMVQKVLPVRPVASLFMTADDFSYYQQQVPGLYLLLGAGETPPLHSSRFSFDQQVLLKGADYFEQLVCTL